MTKSKIQDTILYCQRCGISFLWSQEEQRQLQTSLGPDAIAARPIHCPGCRALLPAPGRERGMVKWYNRRKRFGFIVRRNQPDLFVHGSQLQEADALAPDQLVEFGIIETDKGLAAAGVVALTDPPA